MSAVGTPARVVRAYLAVTGLFTLSASVIWGVNTLFLLDAGLDIFEVFVANAAYTAGMVLFEIPTGVVADTAGRRRSFQLDRVFARGAMVSGAAMLVGTVGGGLLGSVNLAWPFLVRAALLAAVFVVGLKTMHDIGFTPRVMTASAIPE